jgi:hypothetical protein
MEGYEKGSHWPLTCSVCSVGLVGAEFMGASVVMPVAMKRCAYLVRPAATQDRGCSSSSPCTVSLLSTH